MLKKIFHRSTPKKRAEVTVDMHSHIIHKLDDGVKSLEESIDIVKTLVSLGYKKIITTPHIREYVYENSSNEILSRVEVLQEAIKSENIDVTLEVAAEYYLDQELFRRVQAKDILTIDDNYLLFETSLLSPPINLYEAIYEMKLQGYQPILAHPERYRYITKPKEIFTKLKEEGVLFQLDINSLGGHYGREAKKHAKLLVKWKMIDFLGSDLHSLKQASFLSSIISSNYYQKILQTNPIKNNLL